MDAIRPGGAAAAADIKTGDVVVGLAGKPTPDIAEFDTMLIGYRPGDRVQAELLRKANPRQVVVTLASLSG